MLQTKRKFKATAYIATLLVGEQCTAVVVVHENPNQTFVQIANGNRFDPTLSALQQSMAHPERGISYLAASGGGSESPQADAFAGGSAVSHIRSTMPINVTNQLGITTSFFPSVTFAPGDLIGAAQNYRPTAATALFYVGGGNFHTPFLGQNPITGFRLSLADGPHFGWVEWRFGSGPLAGGGTVPMYQPIRWAYETEPNVPITVVPAPAGAAVLASIGLFVARRRRGG